MAFFIILYAFENQLLHYYFTFSPKRAKKRKKRSTFVAEKLMCYAETEFVHYYNIGCSDFLLAKWEAA
jgi:hypothetical protein